MMWWMHHASVVLQYERALPTKKRKMHRSGADLTPELPHLEKRAYYKMTVAQDKALQEAWQEKEISNRDVHGAILDLQKDQREEEDISKKLFRRLDAKLNSIFKKFAKPGGEREGGGGGRGSGDGGGDGGGGGHEDSDAVRRDAPTPGTEGSHLKPKGWKQARKECVTESVTEPPRLPIIYRSAIYPSAISLIHSRLATHQQDKFFKSKSAVHLIEETLPFAVYGAQTDNQRPLAGTTSVPAEVLLPGGVQDSPRNARPSGIAPSPAQSNQTQSSPARTSRLGGLRRLPPVASSGSFSSNLSFPIAATPAQVDMGMRQRTRTRTHTSTHTLSHTQTRTLSLSLSRTHAHTHLLCARARARARARSLYNTTQHTNAHCLSNVHAHTHTRTHTHAYAHTHTHTNTHESTHTHAHIQSWCRAHTLVLSDRMVDLLLQTTSL